MRAVTRRLVFKHTIEGLFGRAYGSQLTPALEALLTPLGLGAAAVDAERFGEGFALLRDAVYPGVKPAIAERQMGARFLSGYFDTAMGGLVKAMLRLLSVEKALGRVPQSLMSGANFIEARVEKRGDRYFHLSMNDYSTSPDFLCGVVEEMVTLAGGKPTVDIVERQGRATVLAVRWT
jgi:uncharacterized protein (TIGR02265 family)